MSDEARKEVRNRSSDDQAAVQHVLYPHAGVCFAGASGIIAAERVRFR